MNRENARVIAETRSGKIGRRDHCKIALGDENEIQIHLRFMACKPFLAEELSQKVSA